VESILGAATRVLVEDGYEGATTNRIAEVAGVSVGSLYQYFPNKEAIIAELFERHEKEMLGQLGHMVMELADAPFEEAVRRYVRAMLAMHTGADLPLHRVLTQELARVLPGGFQRIFELNRRAQELVRAYLEAHRGKLRPKDLDLAAYILVHAVEAATHAALMDRPDLIRKDAFAEELVQLVLRYLLR
jgi:AcrR family transcriptional regulator